MNEALSRDERDVLSGLLSETSCEDPKASEQKVKWEIPNKFATNHPTGNVHK
jgi:hypothetical protein